MLATHVPAFALATNVWDYLTEVSPENNNAASV